MKLGVRFSIALVVPLVALTAALGYLYLQRSRTMLREEMGREGRAIARVVQIAVEDYLRDGQLSDLRELVDLITGQGRVLGLRVFDPVGNVICQSKTLDPYPFAQQKLLASVLTSSAPATMWRRVETQPVVGFILGLTDPSGRPAGAVQVLQLESFIDKDARASRDFILALTTAMVAATVVIVLVITRVSLARPIGELVRSFRDSGEGTLPARVPVRTQDELGLLAREFNGMVDRLEAALGSLLAEQDRRLQVEARLRNAERLAALGRLAAGLAHEIGTPLSVIGWRSEALQRSLSGGPGENHVRIISGQIDRIVRIVRDMLDFARMKEPRRAATDVGAVVRRVLELVEGQLVQAGVQVQFHAAAPQANVTADPDQLQQVFLNVILNAAQAMPGGGTLRVRLEPRTVSRPERPGEVGSFLAVEIEDTGCGIAPEHLDHVFDPFFTTKEAGQGTGLGLSVSYGIVQEHGGWFDLVSEVGRGTRVTIHLPLGSPAPAWIESAVSTPLAC